MRKLKLFFACLLMAVLSIGQMWGASVTMAYTGATTNMGAGNNAASVGLNATSWNVSADKGGNSNYPGLNKSGYIALYYAASGSNTITVTNTDGATINSISITYTGNSYNNGVVKVGSSTISPSDGSYAINASSFSITNGNTSNVQVRISSIVINYTSGSGKTDITDQQLHWSAASASIASNATDLSSLPTLTNSLSLGLTYQSTNTSVATINGSGVISLVGTGETTIKAIFAGNDTKNAKTVSYTLTVTAPAYSYTYNQDFTAISFTGWSSSYDPHTVNYDLYNGHAENDCHVTFAAASKQGSTIDNMPVAKSGAVNLILDDPNKYISAVKFVGEQWGTKAQTMVLKYSTDGGESWTAFDPAKEATNFVIEELNLPAKVNAVQVAGKTSNNQIGYASVHFDLVDKVTYSIGKDETGCTLSVTDGTSTITTAEEGDDVYVSIASTTEGYENASFVVKDADNNTVAFANGKFTMPDKDVTITATATKKTYTVTLSATNGKIQVGGIDKESITVAHGETAQLTAVADDGYSFNGWTSSDGTKVALSGAKDNPVTITVTGAATVTANFVSASKLNPGFAWSAASAEAVKGQAASLPTLTTNPYSLTPTYVSTNTDVAEIDGDGVVTIKAVGSTTIKATYAEGETYAACEAAYTLTVKGRVTWHAKKAGVDATTYADYVKDDVPTKPTGDFIASCHSSISLVGWTTSEYAKSDDAPATLYTGDVPAVTDNAEYYAVWAVVEEGGWNEVTAVANLTAGTYAICSDNYFMKAEKLSSKNRLDNGAATPDISAGKLVTAPVADCQWTISINADGKYLFNNGDNYAVATTTKNEMILSSAEGVANTTHAQWEIARSGNIFEVTNIGRAGDSDTPANKYLRNNTTSGWACYSSNQGGEGYAPRFFKYSAGSATGYTTNCVEPLTVATPTFTPDGSAAYYTEAQTVTISCATVGATIYYSLDETDPSVEYTAPISIDETKTLKAKAVLEDVSSEIAEATFTINLPLTTIQGIFDEATAIGSSAAQERVITFNSWVVSAIGSDEKSVYVTDGEKGFVIYGSNHGFAVGNILSGTVTCNLQLFGDFAEIKDMKYNAQGLNVTTGGTLNPQEVSLKNLSAINTGAPIIINNVTYDNDGDLVDAESYYATPVEWLYTFETSTFETNKIYKVTGIYIYGSNSDKIVPRDADDIVKLTKEQPTLTWTINDTPIGESYSIDNKDVPFAPVCVANSIGSKSYESSNTSVATIDENGVLTVIGNGVTTITCTVAEDDDYVEGSKSFTLKVGIGEASWVAATWASTNNITSNTNFEDKDDKHYATIAIDANVSMTWAKNSGSSVPAYNTDGDGRLYTGNTLTFTASNSKQITSIVFHFKTGYTGTISANAGEYDATSKEWTGFASSVTFTNSGTQARIQSIDIEYAQGTTTTLSIDDIVMMDNDAAADIVYDCNKTNPTIVYSDYSTAVITIANGQITPVAPGQTTVKASIAAEAPYSSAVVTFSVLVKDHNIVEENVVLLAPFGDGYKALANDLSIIDVTFKYGKIYDLTPEQQALLVWKRGEANGIATFQGKDNKFLAVGSSDAIVLKDASTNWTLHENGYYFAVSGRTILFRGGEYNVFKNYSAQNINVTGYSDKLEVVIDPEFSTTYTRPGAVQGQLGTICLPNGGKMEGATPFEIHHMDYAANGEPYKIYLDEVESMVAGRPYFFLSEDENPDVKVYYTDNENASAGNWNGLYGTFENINPLAQGYYIVYNNMYYCVNSNNVKILANRAYIKLSEVPDYDNGQSNPDNTKAPRRISIGNGAPQVVTGMDELNASETPVKMIIDGQLFIIRGEKMFNANGQVVK